METCTQLAQVCLKSILELIKVKGGLEHNVQLTF